MKSRSDKSFQPFPRLGARFCISEAVGLKGGSKHLNYHDLWPRHLPPTTLMEWRASLPGYYWARTISKETFEIDPVYEFCCNSLFLQISLMLNLFLSQPFF